MRKIVFVVQAASAFGIGAARKNGRFDRAYPLTAELLATVWELPNGVMVMPRLLSNLSDAPLLGEAAILWFLSIQPEKGFPIKTGGSLPAYVYIVLTGMLLFGIWRFLVALFTYRQARAGSEPEVWVPKLQLFAWAVLIPGSAVSLWFGHNLIGLAMLVLALMLPITRRKKAPKGTEDWPDKEADREAVRT